MASPSGPLVESSRGIGGGGVLGMGVVVVYSYSSCFGVCFLGVRQVIVISPSVNAVVLFRNGTALDGTNTAKYPLALVLPKPPETAP